jgi:hypothetical protein
MVPKLQNTLSRIFLAVVAAFMSVAGFAQDKKVDVNINSGSGNGNFFSSPWVWIIGVAVFILLLVAFMRGGSRRDV